MKVAITDIYEDRGFNSRATFTQRSVEELAGLLRDKGLIYPVDVQPAADCEIPEGYSYRLLAGYRRMTAAKLLGWTEIDVTVREGLSDEDAQIFNFLENTARKQLTPVEEAIWVGRAFNGESARVIASKVGRSRQWVETRKNILRLPEETWPAIASGSVPLTEVDRIARYDTPEQMLKVYRRFLENNQQKRSGKPIVASRRRKTKAEIIELSNRLMQEGLQGLASKVLIWCTGCIDNEDLEQEITLAKYERFGTKT